jgi:hypothetical protein
MKRTLIPVAVLGILIVLVACRYPFGVRKAFAQAPEKSPAVLPEAPGKDAEALPPIPKADPKSEIKPLLPNNALLLETLPDGKRRVLVAAEVCMREGPLECFLCKKNTKEHESILRTDIEAFWIHTALLAAGAKTGQPVQFVNPKTLEADYKPATGAKVKVLVHYRNGGKLHTHAGQDWVWNFKNKKPMEHEWVFSGSRLIRDPDRPNDPPYYTANSGEIVSISNSPDAMLDLPVEISKDDATLSFEVKKEAVPPLLSKVWLILEPVDEKK